MFIYLFIYLFLYVVGRLILVCCEQEQCSCAIHYEVSHGGHKGFSSLGNAQFLWKICCIRHYCYRFLTLMDCTILLSGYQRYLYTGICLSFQGFFT